jgi:hypothetical protein
VTDATNETIMAKRSKTSLVCRWYGEKALAAIEGPKGSKTEGRFVIRCKCVACQRRRLGYASRTEVDEMVARNPEMSVRRNNDIENVWSEFFELLPELRDNSVAPTASAIAAVAEEPKVTKS